jgi:hypothetical protein
MDIDIYSLKRKELLESQKSDLASLQSPKNMKNYKDCHNFRFKIGNMNDARRVLGYFQVRANDDLLAKLPENLLKEAN